MEITNEHRIIGHCEECRKLAELARLKIGSQVIYLCRECCWDWAEMLNRETTNTFWSNEEAAS